jgi:hypothetical protein
MPLSFEELSLLSGAGNKQHHKHRQKHKQTAEFEVRMTAVLLTPSCESLCLVFPSQNCENTDEPILKYSYLPSNTSRIHFLHIYLSHITINNTLFLGMKVTFPSFTEGRRPLGRPRRRWKDSIKMDIREVGWGLSNGSMWLRIKTGGGLL